MITLFLTIAVTGLLVYLIVTYIPMPDIFKTVLLVFAAICLILYLMGAFGVMDVPVPQLRR